VTFKSINRVLICLYLTQDGPGQLATFQLAHGIHTEVVFECRTNLHAGNQLASPGRVPETNCSVSPYLKILPIRLALNFGQKTGDMAGRDGGSRS
jgi:hypothetical protein